MPDLQGLAHAAAISHELGLQVLMDALNIALGQYRRRVTRPGCWISLPSDDYMASLLQAALLWGGQDNGYDPLRVIATVSRAPMQAAGLSGRGETRLGLRADLLRAQVHAGQAVIPQVWRQAKRVC